MSETNSSDMMHKFEAAGLGKAPFKFVGCEVQDMAYGQVILNRAEYQRTGIMISTQPGGTCAYCGQYIVQMFNVRSADGKQFHVGSDCILKVGDAGLKRNVSKVRTALRHAKEAAKIAELAALLADETVRGVLAMAPHRKALAVAPSAFFVEKSLLDDATWTVENAGNAGKLSLLSWIKRTLKAAPAVTAQA